MANSSIEFDVLCLNIDIRSWQSYHTRTLFTDGILTLNLLPTTSLSIKCDKKQTHTYPFFTKFKLHIRELVLKRKQTIKSSAKKKACSTWTKVRQGHSKSEAWLCHRRDRSKRQAHGGPPWVPRCILGGKTIGCIGHETVELNDLFKALFSSCEMIIKWIDIKVPLTRLSHVHYCIVVVYSQLRQVRRLCSI